MKIINLKWKKDLGSGIEFQGQIKEIDLGEDGIYYEVLGVEHLWTDLPQHEHQIDARNKQYHIDKEVVGGPVSLAKLVGIAYIKGEVDSEGYHEGPIHNVVNHDLQH